MAIEDLIHPLLSSYIASPQWVKTLVGGLYSSVPLSIRRGRNYSHFLEEANLIDPDKLRSLSKAKLAFALKWAIETVPAYRKYQNFLKELDHPDLVLAELPLISKEDIKHDISSFLSSGIPESKRLKTFTGGSTSNPMMFYLHKGVTRTKEYAFIENFHNRTGLSTQRRNVILALRGRSVPTAASGGQLWMYEPIKKHLIVSSDHLERKYMAEYIRAIRLWKPAYIEAFPSALYPLARWLKENPAPDVVKNIRGIMLYSENVYGYQMDLFKEVFPCPILKHYGHSERVLMAASIPDDDRCFFWPQYGHMELVDETGARITQPGILGELVGTGFDNQVMSFVRYRTGDMAVMSQNSHHDLLPGYPAVERIEGRLQEFLVCRDHRLISICTMGAAHFDELAMVEAIQYEQKIPGHFLLKVLTHSPLSKEICDKITRAVEAKAQGGCTAEVIQVQNIPLTTRGKRQMLIQHLDIQSYFGAASEI